MPLGVINIYLSNDLGYSKRCPYKRMVREAVAAIMVVELQAVVEKMYKWMRRGGIWINREGVLTAEEAEHVTQMMLKWVSQKISWSTKQTSVLFESRMKR
jgi:hypothetical protein